MDMINFGNLNRNSPIAGDITFGEQNILSGAKEEKGMLSITEKNIQTLDGIEDIPEENLVTPPWLANLFGKAFEGVVPPPQPQFSD